MITAHIPSLQYGFVEIKYDNRDDFDNNYKKDYVSVQANQHNATIAWKKAQTVPKATPKSPK